MQVAFSRGKDLVGKSIRFFTSNEYLNYSSGFSHCGVLSKDGQKIIHATQIGVHVTSLDTYKNIFPDTVIENLWIPSEESAYSFLIFQLGKLYDFSAIPALIAPDWMTGKRNWQEPDRWFCSELIAAAAVAGGRVMQLKPNLVTPNQLYIETKCLPIESVYNHKIGATILA